MITVWGDRQTGTWQTVETWEDFSPNVVYQFSYTIPEKPWWAFFLPWISWPSDPRWLRDNIVKKIASEAGIPEEEIQVPWFSYNAETSIFQIQIRRVPAPPEAELIPAGLLTIAVIIGLISIPLTTYLLGRIIELAPDTVEKLVEEARKGISWVTVLGGIVVLGLLAPQFFKKKKGVKKKKGG